jgi:molecular chaperone DnaK
VGSDKESLSGFTIEFISVQATPPWRSGKIGLAPDGSFVTNLWAEKGKQTVFVIELCDSKGTKRETVPDQIPYTVGMSITDPPLTHSVGVALANNEVEWYFKKGVPLPVRARADLHTAFYISSKQEGHVIRIPIIEGENERADRNATIGELVIDSSKVKRDVPAGSPIEVTLEIDESRIVLAKAYIPLLDEEFEAKMKYESYRRKDVHELQKDFDIQKKRLEEVRAKVKEFNDLKAQEVLLRIEGERMVQEVETSLAAAGHDSDAADKCQKRLRELMIALDEIEKALEWPDLVVRAEKEVEVERRIVGDASFDVTAEEKSMFAALEREIRNAIANRSRDVLTNKVGDMDRLGIQIVFRQPAWWVAQLDVLEKKKSIMNNQSLADNYFLQGRRAINNNDLESLKAAIRQLWGLLPVDDIDRQRAQSGIMK